MTNKYMLAKIAPLLLLFFLSFGCSTLKHTEESQAADGNIPMYEEGKGRADITLAVLRPSGIDLTADEEKYLGIIQGALIYDINRFSAIRLFDQKNLETILEQQQAYLSGNYSEDILIGIGHLTSSRFLLSGTLTKIENSNYMLDLTVTGISKDEENESGIGLAFFNRTVSLREINNLTASRVAVAELLPQLGVVLTAAGTEAITGGLSTEESESQNALALSYEASRSGNLIDALIYSYTASDANKNSAAAREQADSTFIMMGKAGKGILDDIKQRDHWQRNLIAFENFYRSHPPFEMAYTQVRNMIPDYDNRTVSYEFSIGLRHKSAAIMQKVLNDILKELKQTNYKKNRWGFDNWPAISAESTKANQIKTDLFNGYSKFSIEVALFNYYDEIVATQKFDLYGQLLLKSGNNIGAASTQERRVSITVNHSLISEEGMYIRVIGINGIDADKSNIDSYIKNSSVTKMPPKTGVSIPNNKILLPELPEEKEKREASEKKQRADAEQKLQKAKDKNMAWDSRKLKKRNSFFVSALYNPLCKDDPENAFELEGGLGFGYRHFSLDLRVVSPVNQFANSFGAAGVFTYGAGAAVGYTFVWDYFLLGLEGGATYYKNETIDSFAVLPVFEGKFDLVPWKKGLAFRFGYKAEFGSPGKGDLHNLYFAGNNSVGTDSFRIVGQPTAGIVLWW